jgi:hypothetical protein
MMNSKTERNIENYKNRRREAKQKEANRRNEAKKFYAVTCGMKTGFQPKTSICKDRDSNLIANNRLRMERWKQHFCETLESQDEMKIREELIYQEPKVPTEPQTKPEVWEIIKTLKNNTSPGKDNISADLTKHGNKKL